MTSEDGQNQEKEGTVFLYRLLEQARQYDDLIAMGRGDPDLATPPHILEAVKEGMQRPEPGNPSLLGLPRLRAAIAERVKSINGIEADPEQEVLVTNGAQEAVFIAILTLVEPRSDILVPVPAYNSYRNAIGQARGNIVAIPTTMENDFEVEGDEVRDGLTPSTHTLIMNSPNNPSAAVLSPPTVERLVNLAAEENLKILADDIYDRFLYDGARHLSPASLPGGRGRTLTVNGVSKAYSMTGWRLGWIVGPAPLIQRAALLKAGINGPTSWIAQLAGHAALEGPQDCIDEALSTYTKRRATVLDQLNRMGLKYGRPKGGQFIFVSIEDTGLDGWEFAQRVLEEVHVLVYPGGAFGNEWRSFIRMTFLQPQEILQAGLDKISRVLNGI